MCEGCHCARGAYVGLRNRGNRPAPGCVRGNCQRYGAVGVIDCLDGSMCIHPSPRVASGRFLSDYIASGILADDWLRDYDVDPPDGFEKITYRR